MKTDPVRQLLCESIIGVSLCVGAYVWLVEPQSAKLAKIEAGIGLLSSNPNQSLPTPQEIESAQRALSEVNARITQIEKASASARDESGMFAALMALAAAHRVRVDSLQPVTLADAGPARSATPAGAAPPPPPGATVPEPPPNDTRLAYSMAVVASYSDVVNFLNALQASSGYTVVRSVSMEPTEDVSPQLVRATIDTVHFSFDTSRVIPPVAAAAEGQR